MEPLRRATAIHPRAIDAARHTTGSADDMTAIKQRPIRTARSAAALTALASGLIGILGNIYLVLFYLVAKPWQPGSVGGGYGTVNDWVAALQLVLLIPVVVWLGQQTWTEKWPRRWTGVALIASIAAVLLQLLLVTDVLPFAIQFGPVSVCIVLLYCWAGVISAAGSRRGVLSHATSRLGRLLMWAMPVGVATFAVGLAISALQGEGSWAWVVGGLPGALVWLTFPLWVLLVAHDVASGPHR
jgi:hypothetical protein